MAQCAQQMRKLTRNRESRDVKEGIFVMHVTVTGGVTTRRCRRLPGSWLKGPTVTFFWIMMRAACMHA